MQGFPGDPFSPHSTPAWEYLQGEWVDRQTALLDRPLSLVGEYAHESGFTLTVKQVPPSWYPLLFPLCPAKLRDSRGFTDLGQEL